MDYYFEGNTGAISYRTINGQRHWTSWPDGIVSISKLAEYEKKHSDWEDKS